MNADDLTTILKIVQAILRLAPHAMTAARYILARATQRKESRRRAATRAPYDRDTGPTAVPPSDADNPATG